MSETEDRSPVGMERKCSVARTLQILGDRWIFLILREAFFGIRHYDGFRRSLGIATNILSDRLKTLVEHQIMDRKKDKNDGRRVTYRLTEKGLDLYSVTLAFMQWGDKWLSGHEGPPLTLTHKTCGHTLKPKWACTACGEIIDPRDVHY